jgi:hypothetical protein
MMVPWYCGYEDMAAAAAQEEFLPGTELHEVCSRIDAPRRGEAHLLTAFWKMRPPDGLIIGRDIPSRKIARHLAHVLIWEPLPDNEDARLNLAGEALRLRFGGNAIGHRFSELVDPAIVPFFLKEMHKLLAADECVCFDVRQQRPDLGDGIVDLHFELVIFPVWSPGRKARWILNGVYYFP